jgi:hypothetical protein
MPWPRASAISGALLWLNTSRRFSYQCITCIMSFDLAKESVYPTSYNVLHICVFWRLS